MIHGDVVADDGGFADHYRGAVVDEEAVADLGAGVDFDEREDARDLREEAGEETEAEIPEPVIDAVEPEGVQARGRARGWRGCRRGRIGRRRTSDDRPDSTRNSGEIPRGSNTGAKAPIIPLHNAALKGCSTRLCQLLSRARGESQCSLGTFAELLR